MAASSNVPQDLKWVQARAACTIATVFNEICDGIRSDVEAFNLVKRLREESQFRADMHSDGSTIFIAQPNQIPQHRVIVGMAGEKIIVKRDWNRQLQEEWFVTIGLNDEGRCTLRIDGNPLEQWQFRRRALEGLFFGS